MPRFYVDFALSPDSVVELPDNVVRHLNVLRVKNTEEIVLFNGNGKSYPALSEVLEKRRASVRILREEATDNESPLNITLVQAVSAAERMDFTLQKSVELGVAEIRPVISERCVVRLSGERAEKRVARWQEIVVSACEQSGRNIVPKVLPLTTYAQALQQLPQETTKLLMSLNRAQKLSDVRPQSGKVVFMVGPEGGWTEKEEQQAFDCRFQSVTLGKRVLRTEPPHLRPLPPCRRFGAILHKVQAV